ncbi:MAG TPA: hypothetical protein VF712_12785 [Thermoleophilaceae bacterium]|jgi:hypothetical protein
MSTSPLPVAVLLVWLLAVTGVLRAMAIARRADELADRHWEQLSRMRSESGIAFFPTVDARLELELAISDLVALERSVPRRRRSRRASARWQVAGT